MSPALLTVVYCGIIVAGAVAGALVPVFTPKGTRLVAFLSFAAGVMLGAAFFHMIPEAFHGGGYAVFPVLPAGFVALFLLERYVLVHVCEEPPDCAEHAHGKALGLTAFLGLSAHTLFDGVALGSAVTAGVGFTAFVAIAAHKVPSSLSLAAILKTDGRGRSAILGYGLAYGLMVPLGVGLFHLLSSVLPLEAFAPRALAFSAGTFLYIAVSDLLPRVNRHGRQGRLGNIAALVGGLVLMFGLSLVIGHGHPDPLTPP
ncbi:MAG: ZIP family metal transporter [Myxococcaceae bacterium]